MILRRLREMIAAQGNNDPTDGELLDRFIDRHDEAAFASLVRRHGPMVLRIGRRVLSNPHDAEDVFQATFLALAGRATTIRERASVASWLYGVANRIAMKARRDAARRKAASEKRGCRGQQGDPLSELTGRELCEVLDEELSRLPLECQAALVLCHLEGRTQDQAATQLGLSLSTLKRRLGRGRQILERRLTRRGLTLSVAFAAGTLTRRTVAATVPVGLIAPTVKAGVLLAADKVTDGVVSAKVVALAERALTALSWARLRIGTLLLLLVGLTGSGVAALVLQAARLDAVSPRATTSGGAGAQQREPAPVRSAARVAQDALARVEKHWKPFDNRPNLDEHRWKVLMACLVDVVRAGPGAGSSLEEAAKDGSPWSDSTRAFAAKAVQILRGPARTRERLAVYEVARMDSAHADQPAPDFSLADATGNAFRLRQFRGKVVVLSFIAQDVCPSCQGYLAHLRDAAAEFDRQNVQLVFVATETRIPGRGAHLILQDAGFTVSATYGVAFQWPHDTLGLSRPATFVIDREGVIRFAHRCGTNPARAYFDRQPSEQRHWSYDRPSAEQLLQICEGLRNGHQVDHQKETLATLRSGGVPALIGTLKTEDRVLRARVSRILGELGPQAHEAVEALTACLRDRVGYVRSEAATALGRIGPRAKGAVAALCEALQDPDEGVRRVAAEALGRIGPDAVVAVRALLTTSNDRHALVPETACDAIGRIGPTSVPVLTKALKDQLAHVRLGAARALGQFGPGARVAVGSLVVALKDPAAHVRAAAAEALGRIGPEARTALPALIEAVGDKYRGARREALFALGRIEPTGKGVFPVLLAALRDEETGVRHAATVTLGRVGSGAREAVPALQKALQDRDGYVRLAAATSLWRIDPECKETLLPILVELLEHEEAEVRYGAAQMLRMVSPREAGIKGVR
ncbi:MAG: sigma-70 family RNA polymerase sigma factor [Planctomycetes bacterium]|nr:sigma-70 family RNA polymerase sigma factor [Planctomycetota bacterium]